MDLYTFAFDFSDDGGGDESQVSESAIGVVPEEKEGKRSSIVAWESCLKEAVGWLFRIIYPIR